MSRINKVHTNNTETENHSGLADSCDYVLPAYYTRLAVASTLGPASIPKRPRESETYYSLAVHGGFGRLATRFLFVHNHLMDTRLSRWSNKPWI